MGEKINKNRIDISAVDLEERLLEHKPMEAWLFFRFNSAVTGTRWDVCFLMDVGSAFVFGHIVTPKEEAPPEQEIEKLLKRAYSQFKKWPDVFYCPEEEEAVNLVAKAAASRGIAFVKAPREIFRDLIAPAEEGIKEMFAGRISHEESEPSLAGFIPDTYDPCFCNSGKKFKFCCKPVFMDITDAMVCAEDGKFQEAVACLDRAVEKEGKTPELLCRYAIVYEFFDKEKAWEYRDSCLKLNPNHPRANYILGIDLKEEGKLQDALEAYKKAASCYPRQATYHLNEVWNNIGTVYYEMDDWKKAKEAWEKALSFAPEDEMTLRNLKLLENMPEQLVEITEKIKGMKFESIDAGNDFLVDFCDEKNRRPIAELGGLSPKEMFPLLYAPIGSGESPIVFSRELDEQLLQSSPFYIDAVSFLSLFKERQPVKATAAGNLNRKFVSEAFDLSGYAKKQKWSEHYRPVNEYDFMWLNNMRFVLELAKLIRKRKKAFYLTRLGEELLGKPGELFLLLFQTFFYKFNLCYLQFFQEIPQIQDTINFSLFMARNHCKDWTDSELFTGKVLIEGLRIHREIKFERLSYSSPTEVLNSNYRNSFIEPMINFGLFDAKEIDGDKITDEKLFVKSSKLLEKFINFKFPANPFQPPFAAGGSA